MRTSRQSKTDCAGATAPSRLAHLTVVRKGYWPDKVKAALGATIYERVQELRVVSNPFLMKMRFGLKFKNNIVVFFWEEELDDEVIRVKIALASGASLRDKAEEHDLS